MMRARGIRTTHIGESWKTATEGAAFIGKLAVVRVLLMGGAGMAVSDGEKRKTGTGESPAAAGSKQEC